MSEQANAIKKKNRISAAVDDFKALSARDKRHRIVDMLFNNAM